MQSENKIIRNAIYFYFFPIMATFYSRMTASKTYVNYWAVQFCNKSFGACSKSIINFGFLLPLYSNIEWSNNLIDVFEQSIFDNSSKCLRSVVS